MSYMVFRNLLDESGSEIAGNVKCQISPSDNPDYYPEDWRGMMLVPSGNAVSIGHKYCLRSADELTEILIDHTEPLSNIAHKAYFKGADGAVPPAPTEGDQKDDKGINHFGSRRAHR